MFVRVWEGSFMVDTIGHQNLVPMSYLRLWNYIYRPSRRQREATRGPLEATGGPLEATDASSRAQILAPDREASPPPAPLGPLKLRLFGEKHAWPLGGAGMVYSGVVQVILYINVS